LALESLGLTFKIEPLHISEEKLPSEDHLTYLKRITISKLGNPINFDNNLYISSDTIVVYQNIIYPKPLTPENNFQTLKILSGKTHSVFTGLCLFYKNRIHYDFDESKVTLKTLQDSEIMDYIKTHNPIDKAGGYAIQDKKSPVENLTGSYWNVVGFPMRKFYSYHNVWSDFLKQ